jgi:glycosyltransferase involved in cell wall biosynthesis
MPGIAQALGERQPLVALIHHPLALESGLDCDRARALATTERAALAAACHVVTTSRTTACTLERDYGVSAERITVVVPGTDAVPTACGSGSQQLALLSVGTLVPRKGHDLLLAALAALQDLPWHLTIVGDAHRDPATALALREAALHAGLAGRVVFAGAVDATHLSAHYERADLFVLASRHEGFGMAFAEALAYGLPLLGTTAGAIPEAVPAGAGMLVPPDDLPALTEALRVLLSDQATRKQLGASARAAAAALPPWHASAAVLAGVLRKAAQ